MSEPIRTVWLSDVVDIIDKPETNRIVCHGKEFVLLKLGHWEEIDSLDGYSESDFLFNGEYKCSKCGSSVGSHSTVITPTPYCPWCGSKMLGTTP